MLSSPCTALILALAAACAPGRSDSGSPLPRPTVAQLAFHAMEVGAFIHFMPSTWPVAEGSHVYDLANIRPDRIDTDQWVRVARSMGARYIVFVAKHAPGFRYWQTTETPFGMRQLDWRSGQADIVADLARSCRKQGIRLGIYNTAVDGYWGAGGGGLLGGMADVYRQLRGKTLAATPEAQTAYSELYRREWTELLTRFGPICELWFDGGVRIPIADIIRSHAPDAMVFGYPENEPVANPIRWCGNESGWANYPLWGGRSAVHSAAFSPLNPEYVGDPHGAVWEPTECDTTLRGPGSKNGWGWYPGEDRTVRSLDDLMEIYCNSVGRGAVLLMNLTPDDSGLIPEADARRAAQFGAEIHRRFAHPVARTAGAGTALELRLPGRTMIDRAITMESIEQGQRIAAYVIEGLSGGEWRRLCAGSTVGYKRIDRFPPASVERVRWRCTDSLAEPIIRSFAVFRAGRATRPAAPLTPALWSFEERTGDTISAAGGRLRGRLVNVRRAPGAAGRALAFDGARSYASLGSIDVYDRDFTIGASIRPRAVLAAGPNRMIVSKDRSGVGANQFAFYLGVGNRLGFMLSDGAGASLEWPFETPEAAAPAGRWTRVAVTRRGDRFELFADGRLLATARSRGVVTHTNTLDLRVGARYGAQGDEPDGVFDGLIDELEFRPAALPAPHGDLPGARP